MVFAHFTTFPSERKQENAPAGRLRRFSEAHPLFLRLCPHAHAWGFLGCDAPPALAHRAAQNAGAHPHASPCIGASAARPFSRRSRNVKASERRHNPENPGREPGDSAPKTRPEPRRGGATRRRPPARQPVPALFLRMPPSNRLEALRGKLRGFYSIRVNDRRRIIFRFEDGNAFDVRFIDYH